MHAVLSILVVLTIPVYLYSIASYKCLEIMKEWLEKCDMLSFNLKIKIKDGLRGANKGYSPISMEKLKEENRQLYDAALDRN